MSKMKQAKENTTVYGCLSQRMLFVFEEAGPENCEVIGANQAWRKCEVMNFSHCYTYRIRSDYQLEPEKNLVRYEVFASKSDENTNSVLLVKFPGNMNRELTQVMGWANFSHCVFDVPVCGQIYAPTTRIWCDEHGAYSLVPTDLHYIMLLPAHVEVYE